MMKFGRRTPQILIWGRTKLPYNLVIFKIIKKYKQARRINTTRVSQVASCKARQNSSEGAKKESVAKLNKTKYLFNTVEVFVIVVGG